MIAFPDNFLLGASTSAHQVEGGDFHSDWWHWEQRPGRIRDGTTSNVAADHLARRERDFDLAHKLGHRAHLFSLAWSRIEPEPGRFDEKALAHYAFVLDALAARGIEPICVLQHVSLPAWFAEDAGWPHPDAPDRFAQFAERVLPELASKCRWWIPILEPMHAVTMGHLEGLWPPGQANGWGGLRAIRHLAQAHARAYDVIHGHREDALAGLGIRARRFTPLDPDSVWDLRTARREQRRCTEWCPDLLVRGQTPFPGLADGAALRGRADFLGVSYYGLETIRFAVPKWRSGFAQCTNGLGDRCEPEQCETHPGGLYEVLRELAAYGLPLLVTGNGVATSDDKARCRYLLDHLGQVDRALREGVDVRGYLHRSLLDGFEWTAGHTLRYGLIHVDPTTLARTPNDSAYLFRDVCETGTIRPGTVSRFCPGWRANGEEEGQ